MLHARSCVLLGESSGAEWWPWASAGHHTAWSAGMKSTVNHTHTYTQTHTQAQKHTKKHTHTVFMLSEYLPMLFFFFLQTFAERTASRGPLGFLPNDKTEGLMGYKVTKTEKPTYCSCPAN